MWNETSFRASPPFGKALKTFVNLITYSWARAWAKSAIMSSASSSPMENLRNPSGMRSEEHTSELQSQSNLVCRLLLEKKKQHRSVGGAPVVFYGREDVRRLPELDQLRLHGVHPVVLLDGYHIDRQHSDSAVCRGARAA